MCKSQLPFFSLKSSSYKSRRRGRRRSSHWLLKMLAEIVAPSRRNWRFCSSRKKTITQFQIPCWQRVHYLHKRSSTSLLPTNSTKLLGCCTTKFAQLQANTILTLICHVTYTCPFS
ncbi:hypothetical protein V2J09_013566 [Rumex salicifolius]